MKEETKKDFIAFDNNAHEQELQYIERVVRSANKILEDLKESGFSCFLDFSVAKSIIGFGVSGLHDVRDQIAARELNNAVFKDEKDRIKANFCKCFRRFEAKVIKLHTECIRHDFLNKHHKLLVWNNKTKSIELQNDKTTLYLNSKMLG